MWRQNLKSTHSRTSKTDDEVEILVVVGVETLDDVDTEEDVETELDVETLDDVENTR